ncbi:MAG: Rab family GTPase [Candidatus Hodarchaeales archaeon]|jgi:small GTP-binding protein
MFLKTLPVKIILCGDGGVGKTSLRRAYLGQEFKSNYIETIGADFATKKVEILYDSQKYQLRHLIWDLAGQPIFSSVRSSYYLGCHAILLVYDVTNKESYKNVFSWIKEIKSLYLHKKIPPIALLGNKIDLVRGETIDVYVTTLEGKMLSKEIANDYLNNELTIPYIETSAKTGENVEMTFQILSKIILQSYIKFQRKLVRQK